MPNIATNTNPRQTSEKFRGGIPEDLPHFLSEDVDDHDHDGNDEDEDDDKTIYGRI